MVRGRRGRAAKTGDEVCYASPKRKDSRLENIGNLANGVDVAQQTNGELPKIPSPPTTRSKNGAYGKADKNLLHNGKIVKNTHITNYFHVVSPTNGFDEARISKIPINIKQENGNLQPLFNGTRIEDRDYSEQNGFHTFGMDRYMGFDEISKIIHTVRSESDRKKDILSNIFKREISEMTNVDEARGYDRLGECEIIEENYNPVVMMNGFCPPKLENGFKSNGSSGSFEDVSDIVSESNNEDNNVLPNVRLSPRKHASTMQRCVTVKENVKTPHRIRLCEAVPQLPSHSLQQLSIKPYRKRTRRRLAVKSQDDTSSSDSSLTPSVNLGDNLTVTTKLPCQIIRDEKIISNDCALTNTTCLKAYQNQAVHKLDHTDHTVHTDHKPDHNDRTAHTDHIPDSLVVPDLAKVLKKEEVKIEGKTNGIIANGVVGSHKLTDYFPVRRSVRKTKKEVLEEKQRDLEVAIREEREEGLEVANFEGKGRGVITARNFQRGEFVVEYCGELVSMSEARTREAGYAQDSNKGCYMYYFRHNNHQYCIDATAESGRLGRLVNHSRNGNLLTKAVHLDGRPHLVLLAGQDIAAGEEVTYDYGDRSREALQHHPWLAL